VIYNVRHRWRDGTPDVVFESMGLVEKLARVVPPTLFNLVRYHGVLALGAR
jgi:hypothetical protein